MAKLEYQPVNDWPHFNLLGKRLFDFVNTKLKATTGIYVGDGVSGKQINLDIIPRLILIFSDEVFPALIWIDSFPIGISRLIDGDIIEDGIIKLADRKDGFILGNSLFANDANMTYYYFVLGE